MIIRLIQQKVLIGDEVSIFLKTGEEIRGFLAEIGESHISLKTSNGEDILTPDVIGRFKLVSKNPSHETKRESITPHLESSEKRIQSISENYPNQIAESEEIRGEFEPEVELIPPNRSYLEQENKSTLAVSNYTESRKNRTSLAFSVECITKVTEIHARFSEAIKHVDLVAEPVNFSIPSHISSSAYSVRKNTLIGEWDKLRNKYNYAIKNRELNRFNQIAIECENVAEKYPELSVSATFNAGCLFLEVGNLHGAIENFEIGSMDSDDLKSLLNLAVTSLKIKDISKACYALQKFFRLASPEKSNEAWYKFIELSIETGGVETLKDLLEIAVQENRRNAIQVILESLIFLLKQENLLEDACEIAEFLLEDLEDIHHLTSIFQVSLSRLSLKPTAEYLNQEQKILDAKERTREAKELEKRKERAAKFIKFAQNLAKRQEYNNAISEIRKALRENPDDEFAKHLEKKYIDSIKEQTYTNAGNDLFNQARIAEEREQDLAEAEKLYKKAIKKKVKLESSIKNLAALYRRQNRDEEALELLLEHRSNTTNKLPILNMISETCRRMGRYSDAKETLEEILKLVPFEKQPTVLKRIASLQFSLRQYRESELTLERVLRQTPNDINAQQLIDGLREAKETKIYTKVDALFIAQENSVAEAQRGLSSFLFFHLERCDYEGLEASKKASKQFTSHDVDKLIRRANARSIGTKVPRERANFYLSAAKISVELGESAEAHQTKVFLRNFCAAMGDAFIAENKDKEVIRSYYAEAFSVAPDWAAQLDVKLSQYILLYYSSPEILLQKDIPPVENCLEQALKIEELGPTIIRGLWHLSWLNRRVGQVLLNKITPIKRLRETVQTMCFEALGEKGTPTTDEKAFINLWERGRELIRQEYQEISDEFAFLNSVSIKNAFDTIPAQRARLQNIIQKTKGLEKQRLNSIIEILNYIDDYNLRPAYREREYNFAVIQSRIADLSEEIQENPTKTSLEYFYPYLESINSFIREHFSEIQQLAEPQELSVSLLIESYIPDESSNIDCQLSISNDLGKSPVSDIKVHIEDSEADDYAVGAKVINIVEPLDGGDSVTCELPVQVTSKAKASKVFSLYYKISYSTRTNKKAETSIQSIPIQLDKESDFKVIENPHFTWASAGEVTDPDMFYGRDQFIDNLSKAIKDAPTTKSLVIYGQKRSGKSSILYHLENSLSMPIIPIKFSLGDIPLSVYNFLYRIIQNIEMKFEDLAEQGYPKIAIERPSSISEFRENPEIIFHDFMSNFRKNLKNEKEFKEVKIVLLIDEFTYVYGEILRGNLPDTFMRFWKALLQHRYFGSVLVGQDVMRQFIERFPNEFQVAQSERVSYLAEDDARSLITKPTWLQETNESRYKGNAVKRLMELTAGSPYYIQLFCSRLIEYMNRKKLVRVTEAHIENVVEEMTKENNSLTQEQFDNLISAYDNIVDLITKEDALSVLQNIAIASRLDNFCDYTSIQENSCQNLSLILEDLVNREVLERDGSDGRSRFRIKVGLFKEWLLANK
ncbi:hypothetical protein [Vacuolonema iberomarrocanum]|uniref:hypothetical protein n=1 Tax=Vacuolonema iberomarrocanum TaxID=3454632 RepID=UPI0019FD1CCE|nr:hypothetical protein [filamentous cyanobacterium LEGE 07170]